MSLRVPCRLSLGIISLDIQPCLLQGLLIKLAARHRAFQTGVVNFKTTQLLVVWKVLLKHHANHWIHFSSPLLNAKYANMLLECPAGNLLETGASLHWRLNASLVGIGYRENNGPFSLQGRK